MVENRLHLIGYACGIGGADLNSSQGPLYLKQSSLFAELLKSGAPIQWEGMIGENTTKSHQREDEIISHVCLDLAKQVSALLSQQKKFSVIGGDHTSAIGTWSGVFDVMHQQGDLGLIWLDAHMDSHTPETTESGRIHGMPLACLMGYGYPALTSILHAQPKLKPENVCLIGVRSFESGEAALLKKLNVRTYFMDEVKQRGFLQVWQEAVDRMEQRTAGFGLSIDLDCLDPLEVPGVDVPVKDGILVKELYEGLSAIISKRKLIGTEIVEFDPQHDKDHKTEKVIVQLLKILAQAK